MTALPIFPLNVEEFIADPKIRAWRGEKKAMWLWLLTVMWSNKARLPNDDKAIAKLLAIDIRSWKNVYKPMFMPLLVADCSGIIRQMKLDHVYETIQTKVATNREILANARAQKAIKSTKRASAAGHTRVKTATGSTRVRVNLNQDKEKKEKEKKESPGNGSEATASSPGFEGRSSAVPELPQMVVPPDRSEDLTEAEIAEIKSRLSWSHH